MTLPSSGSITTALIATELGGYPFSIPSTAVRNLTGRQSPNSIIMPTHFYGQTKNGACARTDGDYSHNTSSGVWSQSLAIGNPAWNRVVVTCVRWGCDVNAVDTTIASATIGGVTATINRQIGSNGSSTLSNYGCAVISAIVPTGTTATVAITFSNTTLRTAYVDVFRVTGLASTTAYDSAFGFTEVAGAGTASAGSIINKAANGVEFISAIYSSFGITGGLTFVGATERVDQAGVRDDRHGCAMSFPTSAALSTTVSCSGSSSVTSRMRMIAVTFALV